MSRKSYIVLLIGLVLMALPVGAQVNGSGSSVYHFLSLPVSSRLNALGGDNVSQQEGDLSLAMMNPALLSSRNHMQLSLNYAYFYEGVMNGCAMYGHTINDVHHTSLMVCPYMAQPFITPS